MKCGDITAGMLTTIVAFQRQGAATNTNGDVAPGAWAAIAGTPTRAAVKSSSGYERAQIQRTDTVAMFKVTVRYSALITEKDSVVFKGRRHNITHLDDVELAGKWLIASVTGGVAV